MQSDLPVLKDPEPKKKSNVKIILILVLLFITILVVIFFNSSLSKITEIQISGAQFVSNAEVLESSQIKVGDSFIFASKDKLEQRLLKNSSIAEVKLTKQFPGKIKISIQEYDVVAFELSPEGELIALLASGASIKTTADRMQIMDKPILTGWQSDDLNKKALIKQLSMIEDSQLGDISEISPIPSTAFPDRILVYTRTKFEVITSISILSEKIGTMNGVIETQAPGRLTLLLADTFVPFQDEEIVDIIDEND